MKSDFTETAGTILLKLLFLDAFFFKILQKLRNNFLKKHLQKASSAAFY